MLMAEIKIVRLKYSEPQSVITTLEQLFGKKVRLAPAPTLNAIVINSDDPAVLREIDRLLQELDQRPAMLRYSVRRLSDQDETSTHLQFGQRSRLSQKQQRLRETGINTVVAQEYRKARITDDSIRIFTYPTYFGEAVETITISHGLMVSGRLTGQNSALLEVWYSSGKELDSETLLTSLEVPLGSWVSLGGAISARGQTNPGYRIGKNSGIEVNKSGGQIDRRYLIKVDRVND